MPKTNNLLSLLINGQDLNGKDYLVELSSYLQSNKTYKYTTTYLHDAADNFNRFKTNLVEFREKILNIFFQYKIELAKIDRPKSCMYEIQINKAIFINSEQPEDIQIIKVNEHQLLSFLNQEDFHKHYLNLKFHYNTNNLSLESDIVQYTYIIEHTFEIKKEEDIEHSIRYFINLLKIDLWKK